jgi:hypothetical protein
LGWGRIRHGQKAVWVVRAVGVVTATLSNTCSPSRPSYAKFRLKPRSDAGLLFFQDGFNGPFLHANFTLFARKSSSKSHILKKIVDMQFPFAANIRVIWLPNSKMGIKQVLPCNSLSI